MENKKYHLWEAFLHGRCKVVFNPCRGSGGERGRLNSSCSHLQRKLRNSVPSAARQSRPTESSVWDGALPQFTVTVKAAVAVHHKLKRASLLYSTSLPPAPASRNPTAATASNALLVEKHHFSGMATGSSESSTAEPFSEKNKPVG